MGDKKWHASDSAFSLPAYASNLLSNLCSSINYDKESDSN